ncbi:hypothetical protein HDU92_008243, partial [Lobulomyces angularis]
MIEFFQNSFNNINKNTPINVYLLISELLVNLIQEAPSIPSPVCRLIINHFEKKKKIENITAHQMAIDICKSTTMKLQRFVCQHFSELLNQASNTSIPGSPNSSSDEAPSSKQEAAKALLSVHKLILQIHNNCPDLLINVIPQLEMELECEVETRSLAVQILGEMFLDSRMEQTPGMKSFYETWPGVWKSWCDRRNDSSVLVRTLWVELCANIFKFKPELIKALTPCLHEKLMDLEEKVRIASINVFKNLTITDIINIPKSLLLDVSERCRDKKINVRNEAATVLAKIYNKCFKLIKSGENLNASDKFGWIPSHILNLQYVDDKELIALIERLFNEEILPPNLNDDERTDRTLIFLDSLFLSENVDRNRKAFLAYLDRQDTFTKNFNIFLDVCEEYNGGIMDNEEQAEAKLEMLEKIIHYISTRLGDPKKSQAALTKFTQLNDKRCILLLRNICNPALDYKTVVRYHKELKKKFEENHLSETFSIIQFRISFLIINKSMIPSLLKRKSLKGFNNLDIDLRLSAAADVLIKDIALKFPAIFRSNLNEFIKMLRSDDESEVTDALFALSSFLKEYKDETINIGDSKQNLIKIVLQSESQKKSKYASVIAANLQEEDTCLEIFERVIAVIKTETNFNLLLNQLNFLKVIAFFKSNMFDKNSNLIFNFIINQVLLKEFKDMEVEGLDTELDWVEYEKLPISGRLKLTGLKVLVKRLLKSENDEDESLERLSISILKLFKKIFLNEGEILNISKKNYSTNDEEKKFEEDDENDKEKSLTTPNDPIFQVRQKFLEKVMTKIQKNSVPKYFILILMLCAHEPEKELKDQIKSFLARKSKESLNYDEKTSQNIVCKTFPRFLHLLSHHPDFTEEEEDLIMFSKYILFFLEAVGSAENISLLYHLISNLKTVEDIHSKDSTGFYILCDMTLYLIKDLAKQKSWVLTSFNEKVSIDKTVFKKLDVKQASLNLKKIFLGNNFINAFNATIDKKKPNTTPKKKSTPVKNEETRKKKNKNKLIFVKKKKKDENDDNTESDNDSINENEIVTPIRRNAKRSSTSIKKDLKEISNSEESDTDIVMKENDAEEIESGTESKRSSPISNTSESDKDDDIMAEKNTSKIDNSIDKG